MANYKYNIMRNHPILQNMLKTTPAEVSKKGVAMTSKTILMQKAKSKKGCRNLDRETKSGNTEMWGGNDVINQVFPNTNGQSQQFLF